MFYDEAGNNIHAFGFSQIKRFANQTSAVGRKDF